MSSNEAIPKKKMRSMPSRSDMASLASCPSGSAKIASFGWQGSSDCRGGGSAEGGNGGLGGLGSRHVDGRFSGCCN